MSIALLFPGQGSQSAGMRDLVARHEPELLELALSEIGADPFALADQGTAYAQPAILAASLAAFSRAGRPSAALLAGHSLGELSALAAGGAIEATDALRLAVVRGRSMGEAAAAAPGGMLALLGDAEAARRAAASSDVVIANDNAPTQIVVSGPDEALDATEREAKTRGVRAIRIAVAGAFHSPAMEPALAPFRAALELVAVSPPAVPVFSSSTGEPFADDADAIREQLAAAPVSPVRWRETLAELHRRGVREFVEVGPGKALTRIVRRTFDGVEARTLDGPEAVHA